MIKINLLIMMEVYNLEYSDEENIEYLMAFFGKPHTENCKEGTINLYSSDSKIIYSDNINITAGILDIDLSSYPSGGYIIELSDCYGNSNSLKIIKTE